MTEKSNEASRNTIGDFSPVDRIVRRGGSVDRISFLIGLLFPVVVSHVVLILGVLILVGCHSSDSNAERDLSIESSRSLGRELVEKSSTRWPNLFGPGRQSQIFSSSLPDHIDRLPKEVWRIRIGTGYSSPVLEDDRVFVVHRKQNSEIVECFSLADGSSQWTHSFPASYECPYEYSSGPYSTPVLFDDKILTVGQAGHTVCLLQQTGEVVWERDLFSDFNMQPGEWPVAASGIVVDGRFIFNLGAREQNAGIIGLDTATGDTLWQSTRHEAGHATPNLMTINDQAFVIMVTSTGLVCMAPDTGKECWFEPFRRKKAETYNAVSPVVFGNKVCMVTGPGPGTMLVEVSSSNQQQVLWKDRRILDSQYTNLVCADGFLFGFTPMKQGGPELRCIDLTLKKIRWKWKAGLGRAMLLACNRTLLILGEKGTLAAIQLSPDGPSELFRSESPILEGPCYSAPALVGNQLLLRNEEELVCLRIETTKN